MAARRAARRLLQCAAGGTLCLGLIAASNAADDAVDAIKKGQPEDVVQFINRHVECVHWGGEEPYDEERKKEIFAAVEKLGCLQLDDNERALRKKYAKDSGVLKAVDRIKALYY
jgi:hypothetical protein